MLPMTTDSPSATRANAARTNPAPAASTPDNYVSSVLAVLLVPSTMIPPASPPTRKVTPPMAEACSGSHSM